MDLYAHNFVILDIIPLNPKPAKHIQEEKYTFSGSSVFLKLGMRKIIY